MLCPLGHAAHHPAGATGGDDCLLELESIPFRDRLSHSFAVILAAEDPQRSGTVVRKIGMDITPATVFGRIHAHHWIALVPDLGAVYLQIMPAAQRRDGLAQIDRHLLTATRAQFPKI